jgi:hypothetical protein
MDSALQELQDAADDLCRGNSDVAQGGFERLLAIFDAEPFRSFLVSLLPEFDFAAWWQSCAASPYGKGAGSRLRWPTDRRAKIACQIELCRHAASAPRAWLEFAYHFIGTEGNFDDRLRDYCTLVVWPLVRDLARLTASRAPPAVLAQSLARGLPQSSDSRLDELLDEAVNKFLDKSPVVQKEGLERLWDAWERLKTLADADNKKKGIGLLISGAGGAPDFAEVLNAEARALTDIGNEFQIRHFEQNKEPLRHALHVEYLFHRMFALVRLLLESRSRSGATIGK